VTSAIVAILPFLVLRSIVRIVLWRCLTRETGNRSMAWYRVQTTQGLVKSCLAAHHGLASEAALHGPDRFRYLTPKPKRAHEIVRPILSSIACSASVTLFLPASFQRACHKFGGQNQPTPNHAVPTIAPESKTGTSGPPGESAVTPTGIAKNAFIRPSKVVPKPTIHPWLNFIE
jgi:hypothetical protein